MPLPVEEINKNWKYMKPRLKSGSKLSKRQMKLKEIMEPNAPVQ